MVRGYVQEHIFRHPWERVSAASWRKYADMEHRQLLSHVVDVNIVNRSVDQEAGQLLTTRAITVKCLEESIVDNGEPLLPMSNNFLALLLSPVLFAEVC
jgi:hypothetical protein